MGWAGSDARLDLGAALAAAGAWVVVMVSPRVRAAGPVLRW